MSYFASTYAACVENNEANIVVIKWSADLKRKAEKTRTLIQPKKSFTSAAPIGSRGSL